MSDVMERPIAFSADALRLDAAAATDQITAAIRAQVLRTLRKRGVVLGLSGGIDSSVTAALCSRALGPEKVFAVLMPEKDSDPDSLRLGRLMVDALGIASAVEDIAPILAAAGCYRPRDDFTRHPVPEFGPSWWCSRPTAGSTSCACRSGFISASSQPPA